MEPKPVNAHGFGDDYDWVASPPTFLKAFPGPRGRPDLKNATK